MSSTMVATLSPLGEETTRSIRWHILPFLWLGQTMCFLDRINISFAALQMNTDLKLSPAVFGFAAGVFFLGYFFFEVPSNIMMAKFGARVWLARIMFTWGIIAMATAFVRSGTSLSIVRFLLGVAEAGFFPGLILYSTHWFRSRDRAKAAALMMVGSATASVIAGPLSGWLLGCNRWGFRGWQWLFLVEGAMPIMFAVIILLFWTNRPADAKWLRPEQKEWITNELAKEAASKGETHRISVLQALTRPGTLVLALVYFMSGVGNLGVMFWMPQLLKSVGKSLSPMGVGLLSMLPNITFIIVILGASWHADRTGERHWHVVGALLIGTLGLYLFPFAGVLWFAVLVMCLAIGGLNAWQGNFWASATKLLGEKEAAAGFALINSGAALGGFAGPFIAGIVKGKTGSFVAPMMVLASFALGAAIIMHLFFVRTRLGHEETTRLEQANVLAAK